MFGWASNDRYPRHLAVMNGNGNADTAGFEKAGVYIAMANGEGGLNKSSMVMKAFRPAAGG